MPHVYHGTNAVSMHTGVRSRTYAVPHLAYYVYPIARTPSGFLRHDHTTSVKPDSDWKYLNSPVLESIGSSSGGSSSSSSSSNSSNRNNSIVL